MTKDEFVSLIGKDIVVDHPFFGEIQRWSMRNFYIQDGVIKHKRIKNLKIDNFIANARNPHKGKATHG